MEMCKYNLFLNIYTEIGKFRHLDKFYKRNLLSVSKSCYYILSIDFFYKESLDKTITLVF